MAKPKSLNLNILINELKNQITENSELINENLETLAHQLEQQSVNERQAHQILQYIRHITKVDQRQTVQSIWSMLKEKKCKLHEQHYASMMQFYQNNKDLNGALKTFDEMEQAKLKPSP